MRHEMARLRIPKAKTLDPRLKMSRMTGGAGNDRMKVEDDGTIPFCGRLLTFRPFMCDYLIIVVQFAWI